VSFGIMRGRDPDVAGVGLNRDDLPPFEAGRFDPRGFFAHPERPFEIEIGSGKGTFLLAEASANPETNLLGIEQAGEFWRYAADRLRRHGLANVKVLWGDAVEFVRHRVEDGVARTIHLYFSDPWPKARHHKRRVLQDRSLEDLHRVLMAGGELRLVTDHADLWAWYEDLAGRHADRWERRPFARPEHAAEGEIVGTNFERKFREEGRTFHAMTLLRR
jgi:tRNA (guanine-N7-)-methyltransferase